MAKLIRHGNYIIDLDKVTFMNGNGPFTRFYFGENHWVEVAADIDYVNDFINNEVQFEDSKTEKELARVTRDYEELARENDRLKEMNLQLLTAHGRRVYKKMTHKINLEDIYDSESGDE